MEEKTTIHLIFLLLTKPSKQFINQKCILITNTPINDNPYCVKVKGIFSDTVRSSGSVPNLSGCCIHSYILQYMLVP